MMMSPDSYIEDKNNLSLDELYKEKKELENEMKELRKTIRDNKNNKEKLVICPTPETQLSVYKEYLRELKLLIQRKESLKEQHDYCNKMGQGWNFIDYGSGGKWLDEKLNKKVEENRRKYGENKK